MVKQKVPGKGNMLTNAQIVAMNGDKLSVAPEGTKDAREVNASDVQSYQAVYGILRPGDGAQPIIDQTRK